MTSLAPGTAIVGAVLLSLPSLAAQTQPTPFADAPIAVELRTRDASFAAMFQGWFRTPQRDPRPDAENGSIRVRLRHRADMGVRAAETSVGPPLGEGVFAELEVAPAIALAAWAAEIDRVRPAITRNLGPLLQRSGWSEGSGKALLDGIVATANATERITVRLVGDPRPLQQPFTIAIDVLPKTDGQLAKSLALLRSTGRGAPGLDAMRSGLQIDADVDLAKAAPLLEPLLPYLTDLPQKDQAHAVLAALDGSLSVVTDLQDRVTMAVGVADAEAARRLLQDETTFAANIASARAAGRELRYRTAEPKHRDVTVVLADRGPDTEPFAAQAVAGSCLFAVSTPSAPQRLRELLDAELDGKRPRRPLPESVFARIAAEMPRPAAKDTDPRPRIRCDFAVRDGRLRIDVDFR